MLKSLRARYNANKKAWNNEDGYVQPMIPYWAFLLLLSTPAALLGFMLYQIVTR